MTGPIIGVMEKGIARMSAETGQEGPTGLVLVPETA
jgi:hypothetical protein